METFRLIIAGDSNFTDYALLQKKVDVMLAARRFSHQVEIVCGKAKGAATLGEQYAKSNGFKIKYFPADAKAGKPGDDSRHQEMPAYADACICFWDSRSADTKHLIDLATAMGLPIRVIPY